MDRRSKTALPVRWMAAQLSEADRLKRRAAAASLGFNLLSTLFKVVAAALTHSVSLFSEAVHSTTDVIASSIAFVSVRAAAMPPDEEHPYGHGKIEALAGFGESILLLLVVIYIIFEAVGKLLAKAGVEQAHFGMAVMAASAAGNIALGIYVGAIGKRTRSLALQSNGQHLRIDAVTSAGVLVALAISHLTGWKQADGVMAILLAAWIMLSAWRLGSQAFHQLIDRRLPEDEVRQIEEIVGGHDGLISYHRLRSRLSGSVRYIDMHIVVPTEWSVVQAHEIADRLEKRIADALAPAQVVVHVDPYDATKA